MDWVVLLGSITLVMILAFLVLVRADALFRRMGRSGPLAMSRILGLIITGVGVRLIEIGVKEMA